jgi:hypothetical protein
MRIDMLESRWCLSGDLPRYFENGNSYTLPSEQARWLIQQGYAKNGYDKTEAKRLTE